MCVIVDGWIYWYLYLLLILLHTPLLLPFPARIVAVPPTLYQLFLAHISLHPPSLGAYTAFIVQLPFATATSIVVAD